MTIRKTINCRLVSFTTNKGSNMREPIKRRTLSDLKEQDYEALERFKPIPKSKYDVELMLLTVVADTYPLEHPYTRGIYAQLAGRKAEYKYLFGVDWINPLELEEGFKDGDTSF